MKKYISLLIAAALAAALTACGTEKTEAPGSASMMDLTAMSSTVMFAELFNMTMTPDDYVGRTVKMQGQFGVLPNPITGQEEFAILAVDAAACCIQGLDLALAESYAYPDAYPAPDSQVTVTGTYEKYTDGGMTRYRIGNAVWE